MSFTWKDKKDMYKGEGIYFLTFVVNNRVNLLGELKRLEYPGKEGHQAFVDATDLGNIIYREFGALQVRCKGLQVIAKQVMPNHFHAVVWCHEDFEGSIKMVARGFAQGCSKIARNIYQARLNRTATDNITEPMLPSAQQGLPAGEPGADVSAGPGGDVPVGLGAGVSAGTGAGVSFLGAQFDCAVPAVPAPSAPSLYDCGNGASTLFEKPFIRTLSHAGQLRSMVDYTHNNPDNALLVRLNPELYVIRRNRQYAGLRFDAMGKERLLTYPDRNVVALPRALNKEQIEAEVSKALRLAESGAVTYTAAINDGERAVAKAVREAGWPLVVMMLEGFPPEGSDAARFFHPKGVYHTACGEGRLMLLAPHPDNYSDPRVIQLTEQELARKAAAKGLRYTPLPRVSTRWRMIAGNVMLRLVSGVEDTWWNT